MLNLQSAKQVLETENNALKVENNILQLRLQGPRRDIGPSNYNNNINNICNPSGVRTIAMSTRRASRSNINAQNRHRPLRTNKKQEKKQPRPSMGRRGMDPVSALQRSNASTNNDNSSNSNGRNKTKTKTTSDKEKRNNNPPVNNRQKNINRFNTILNDPKRSKRLENEIHEYHKSTSRTCTYQEKCNAIFHCLERGGTILEQVEARTKTLAQLARMTPEELACDKVKKIRQERQKFWKENYNHHKPGLGGNSVTLRQNDDETETALIFPNDH